MFRNTLTQMVHPWKKGRSGSDLFRRSVPTTVPEGAIGKENCLIELLPRSFPEVGPVHRSWQRSHLPGTVRSDKGPEHCVKGLILSLAWKLLSSGAARSKPAAAASSKLGSSITACMPSARSPRTAAPQVGRPALRHHCFWL